MISAVFVDVLTMYVLSSRRPLRSKQLTNSLRNPVSGVAGRGLNGEPDMPLEHTTRIKGGYYSGNSIVAWCRLLYHGED